MATQRGPGGLLLVHAHPDDEVVATGGLIARSVSEGRRVDLVTCTGGEEGEIHDPDLDPAEATPRLAEIRRAELECALLALGEGLVNLHLLGYRDSGMMGTEANERPESFWKADLEEATGRVVRIVREARPAVIVTYDENGNYGHPDHINAHRVASAAFDAAADPARYPEAGAPHEVAKLYHVAWNREAMYALMQEMRDRGIELPWDLDAGAGTEADAGTEAATDAAPPAEELNPTNIEAVRQISEDLASGAGPEDFGTPEAEITTSVDVFPFRDQKRRAMECHRTQRQDMGWLLDLPEDLQLGMLTTEWFVLKRWRGREWPADHREATIFAEL